MARVNIHDAKTHLSRLIVRAQRGEEIIIAKAGKPVAKLVGMQENTRRPKPGLGKGTIKFHAEVTDPMPEDWLDEFYYGEIFPPQRK